MLGPENLGGRLLLRRENLSDTLPRESCWQALERVVRNGAILLGAKNQANRRILRGICPVLPRVVQIEVHLPCVSVRELPELQINDDQAPQAAMVEQEVDTIPCTADTKATLPTGEREISTEFKQKRLDLLDQRCFELGFGILIPEAEKLPERMGL